MKRKGDFILVERLLLTRVVLRKRKPSFKGLITRSTSRVSGSLILSYCLSESKYRGNITRFGPGDGNGESRWFQHTAMFGVVGSATLVLGMKVTQGESVIWLF